jgi:hypothetical protein
MIGSFATALQALLVDSLPGVFGGKTPAVSLSVANETVDIDLHSAEATAGEPRPDDQTDDLTFKPKKPGGPYQLSQTPLPDPRRVRLITKDGARVALRPEEIAWDPTDPRAFSLILRPERDLSEIATVQVLYSMVSVFTTLSAVQSLDLELKGSDRLNDAAALAIAVIQLTRQALVDKANADYQDGAYGAAVKVKSFGLIKAAQSAPDACILSFASKVDIRATRTLAETEGTPIERIVTPGQSPDSKRRIDIRVDLD